MLASYGEVGFLGIGSRILCKIPRNWPFDTLLNGFITEEMAFGWLYHFQIYIAEQANRYPRLLFVDRHDTHLIFQGWSF